MTAYDKQKYATSEADIPKTEHFAVLVPKSVHIPDQNDGYGSDTVKTWDYIVFADRAAWVEYIQEQTVGKKYGSPTVMIPMHVTPAAVTVNVTVDIK